MDQLKGELLLLEWMMIDPCFRFGLSPEVYGIWLRLLFPSVQLCLRLTRAN